MDRFSACNELELRSRLERLVRDELDLHERIQYRIAELKGDDRWVQDDPAYQRLYAALHRVRMQLVEAREAALRPRDACAL